MKRTLTIILLAILTSIGIQARHITSSEALQLAFSNTGNRASMVASAQNYLLAYSTDTYYAYNNTDNGFVILAADDCLPDLVLGYSDNGQFDYAAMPDAMKGFLEEMSEELAMFVALHSEGTNRAISTLDVLEPIAPLVSSRWNQNSPYNLMAPTSSNGERCLAGCVPVAMGQVMNHYQWPLQGTGSYSYSWDMSGTQHSLSMDFSQSIYDWDNVCDTYDYNSTEEQKNAVAKLLLDCGVSVRASYNTGGTSAYDDDVLYALVDYFDYDKSIAFVNRQYYTKREWRDLLYSNLAEGRPVYYSGRSLEIGHAFVCDGYKDGLFHINWGWGGMSDGYFQIALLDPAEQGLGGSSGGYQFNQRAIIGIEPNHEGLLTRLLYCTNDFKTNTKKAEKTANVNFTGSFENMSCLATTVSFGIRVADEAGNIQYVASSNLKNKKMQRSGKLMNMTVPMADATLAQGDYIITPAYYDTDKDEWAEIRVNKTAARQYVIASVTENDSIFFSTPTIEAVLQTNSLEAKNRVLTGYSTKVDFNVSCTEGAYMNNVYVAFLESGTDNIVSKSDKTFVDLEEGEDFTYSCYIDNPAEEGVYDIVLLDEKKNIISERVSVTVEKAPEGDLKINGKMTVKSKAIDDLRFNLNLECTSGVFNYTISIYVYDNQYNCELSIPGTSTTFLVAGDDPIDILYSASSNLIPGKKYFANAYYPNPSWTMICGTQFKAEAGTGIEEITEQQDDDSPCYNIVGQKVDAGAKGIIIRNGKKYINLK